MDDSEDHDPKDFKQGSLKGHWKERTSKPLFSVFIIAAFIAVFIVAEIRDKALDDMETELSEKTADDIQDVLLQDIDDPGLYSTVLRNRIEQELGRDDPLFGLKVRRITFDEKDLTRPEIRIFVPNQSTKAEIRSKMLEDTHAVFRIAFEDERVRIAAVYLLRPYKRIFGITAMREVMMFRMSSRKASRIDWLKFRPEDIPKTADFSFELSHWY